MEKMEQQYIQVFICEHMFCDTFMVALLPKNLLCGSSLIKFDERFDSYSNPILMQPKVRRDILDGFLGGLKLVCNF